MGGASSIPSTNYRVMSLEQDAKLAHTLIVARERLLKLRAPAQSVSCSDMFIDSTFLLELPSSLEPPASGTSIEWLRPPQIHPQLSLFGSDGPLVDDVWQGELGDCYLLSVLCMLVSRSPDSIRDLFVHPSDTSHLSLDGRYILRFYVDGALQDVEIDDRLPCLTAPSMVTRPVFAKTCSYPEAQAGIAGKVWVCLVEKAYSKLFGEGRYGGIVPGKLADAAIDLSGGIVEKRHPQKAARAAKKKAAGKSTEQQCAFFDEIFRARADGAMLAASASTPEARKRTAGIIPDHVCETMHGFPTCTTPG
jgi:hypothetical protein